MEITISIIFVPLKEGGIAFCTSYPAFGVLNASDKRIVYQNASIAEYRDGYKEFLLSPDGMTIAFTYEISGKSPAQFSISERSLKVGPARDKNPFPPVTSTGRVRHQRMGAFL